MKTPGLSLRKYDCRDCEETYYFPASRKFPACPNCGGSLRRDPAYLSQIRQVLQGLEAPQVECLPEPPETKAPRSCNTGAQISAHSYKVDWLEFTVKGVSPDFAICEYLDLDPATFVLADYAMHGYSDLLEVGTVKVLHTTERPERGTKIILCSSALDEVGRDAVDIIRDVLRDGGTFARLDLALDDRYEYLDLDVIEEAVNRGEDVTHFADVEPKRKYNRSLRQLVARGINWGSRKGSRFLRIYDKRLERMREGEDDPGHWIRVELECKKRGALAAAVRIAETGAACIPAIVRGALDFRDPESDENTTRRTSVGWWEAFFDGMEGIKTGVRKAVSTIQDSALWLSHQCKKSIGKITAIFGQKALFDLVRDGINAVEQKEWERLGVPFLGPQSVKNIGQRWFNHREMYADAPCPF